MEGKSHFGMMCVSQHTMKRLFPDIYYLNQQKKARILEVKDNLDFSMAGKWRGWQISTTLGNSLKTSPLMMTVYSG